MQSGSCKSNPCGIVTIIKGSDRSFYVDLFYEDTGEPFDLTDVDEIIALFPKADGHVDKKFSEGDITVIGAPGAGRIEISVDDTDTSDMLVNPNPQQYQALQINVTIGSVDLIFILQNILNIKPSLY